MCTYIHTYTANRGFPNERTHEHSNNGSPIVEEAKKLLLTWDPIMPLVDTEIYRRKANSLFLVAGSFH